MLRSIRNPWMFAAAGVVGLVLAPVLVGFAPLGGDPEQMYQPIKSELARALAEGRLPFWSHRFGLGVPLVAESHVAAFYPLNWLIYRLGEVGAAYRWALWLHMVALAAATYLYARCLAIGPAGSALAAIGFALCGFQAVHIVHEPFYHLMPFLPLCLVLADRYAATGRVGWLAGLAIAWGTQVTLGHFQIQMWTAGLVLVMGAWRAMSPDSPAPEKSQARAIPRRFRACGLFIGLAWGAAIALIQLRLTSELTGVSGFVRPPEFLANYSFPPNHWAQFALPAMFLGRPGAPEEYWSGHGTTAGEACAYVGVVPLILAFVGLAAAPRDRALRPWLAIGALALALATMPGWWPDGFRIVLSLPGLGLFRAPARYTLLTDLALVLLAARGLDQGRSIASGRFRLGLVLATVFGAIAWAWTIRLAQDANLRASLGPGTIIARFAGTGVAWVLGLAAVLAWRRGRSGAWAPVAIAAIELGALFYSGPTWWAWAIRLPASSPALTRLTEMAGSDLVASRLLDIPVTAGLTTAFPALGIVPPPPNYLLEPATRPPAVITRSDQRWLDRFGVRYGIWGAEDDVRSSTVLAEIPDPALDRFMAGLPRMHEHGPWKLVRYGNAFPPAWASRRIVKAESWGRLYSTLAAFNLTDEAWYLAEDGPIQLPEPFASEATVRSWDGRTAVVDHDGSCVLVLRRTFYPGWFCRVNGGPERPVRKVNGGLQGVVLAGAGPSRVETVYRPTGLRRAATVSLIALGAAAVVLAAAVVRASGLAGRFSGGRPSSGAAGGSPGTTRPG